MRFHLLSNLDIIHSVNYQALQMCNHILYFVPNSNRVVISSLGKLQLTKASCLLAILFLLGPMKILHLQTWTPLCGPHFEHYHLLILYLILNLFFYIRHLASGNFFISFFQFSSPNLVSEDQAMSAKYIPLRISRPA